MLFNLRLNWFLFFLSLLISSSNSLTSNGVVDDDVTTTHPFFNITQQQQNSQPIVVENKMNKTIFLIEDQEYQLDFSMYFLQNSKLFINSVTIGNSEERVLTILNQFNVSQNIINYDFSSASSSSASSSSRGEFNESIQIRAEQIGLSLVTISINYKVNDSMDFQITNATFRVIVNRVGRVVEVIFRVIVTILVVALTFSMGADLDRKVIWAYIKKPIAPMIGFASQYVLMPLIAFALSQALPIPKAMGFGLVTIGCSPGGGGSNVWTMLLKGDLNLSMTMTFFSSIMALGMMPAWIYILGRFYIDTSTVSIPYAQISIQMLMVVIPVILGMAFRWKFEIAALKVTRLIRPLSLFFILFVLTFGTYVNWYIFRLFYHSPLLLIVGALLPWCGFLAGATLAFLLRQSKAQIVAIGLETGIQNIGIAILLLLYSMPQPDGQLGASMPIAVALFTPLPLYITLIVRKIRQKFCKQVTNNDPEEVKENIELSEHGGEEDDEYSQRVYHSEVHKQQPKVKNRTPQKEKKLENRLTVNNE